MNITEENNILYKEVQRPRQWWLWGLLLFVAALFWYIFIKQIFFGVQVGDKPATDIVVIILWAIFGVAFLIVPILFLKLVIQIRKDGIYIRFTPFHIRERKFLFNHFKEYENIPYRVLDYGGWGIRINLDGEIAYNINGKKAIRLTMDHQIIVIGTENPDEFIRILNSVVHGN